MGRPAQIGGQHRPGPHRKHAGLWALLPVEAGHIAAHEYARMRERAQAGVHPCKAPRILGQSAVPDPVRRHHAGDPEQPVEPDGGSVGQDEFALPRRRNRPETQFDAGLVEFVGQHPLRSPCLSGQEFQCDNTNLHTTRQGVARRERQLHTPRSAAHEQDPRARPGFIAKRPPMGQEPPDRLDRHPVVAKGLRNRPAVDRQHIEAHGRPVHALDRVAFQVQPRNRIDNQTGAGKPAQWTQVDVNVFPPVVPRHVSRQHAGVRRMGLPGDDGDAHPCQRRHPQRFQHLDMAVAAPDQHEVEDRRAEISPHGSGISCRQSEESGTRSERDVCTIRRQ